MNIWQDDASGIFIATQVPDGAPSPAAYGCLRNLLSSVDRRYVPEDWVFAKDTRGKPHVVGGSLHVSLSHTTGLVAAAVSTAGPVGIDVEARDRRVPYAAAVARRFFTPTEAEDLAAITDPEVRRERFIRLWTVKEAVVKATGSGLAQSLKTFVIVLADTGSAGRPRLVPLDTGLGGGGDWHLLQRVDGNHVLAAAHMSPSPKMA